MIPFWSLNDRLCDAELEEQIERMHDVGIDGFFLHARGGLETEYMSEDWLARMETCIKKADELGMQAWLYDENGWPSGFGNGIVPKESEQFQQKKLCHCRLETADAPLPEHLLGIYRLTEEGVVRLEKPEADAVAMYYVPNPYYVDVLCKEATLCFIENTHEKYYARLKPYFDGRIKGFFTDEPQYACRAVPWSESLRQAWLAQYDSDPLEALPLLFFDVEGAGEFRYRYFCLAAHLIAHHFLKPMYDWCEAHNCALTGHMMLEDTLKEQVMAIGAAMPCYEFFQMPGIDYLCRMLHTPLLSKQLGSAASQLGRPTITETFAGCGWDVSLNELKWIAQSQFVNGVTSICQHLEGYTLRGLRKRDWPASLFIQQPWFDEAYRPFNDYFNRLGALLREGEETADVLLLHPIRSAYMCYNLRDLAPLNELDQEFRGTVSAMCEAQVLYHLGDEELMLRHGAVTADGLTVGRCTYRTVVLPTMYTISESTYQLLMKFVAAGGHIFSVGEKPTMIDARVDARIDDLLCHVQPATVETVQAAVAKVSVRVDGAPVNGMHVTMRTLDEGKGRVYITNLTTDTRTCDITLAGHHRVWTYDVLTDTHTVCPVRFEGANTVVTLTFACYADRLLETAPAEEETPALAAVNTVTLPLGPRMKLANVTDNGLTLDFCRWRVDGGEWQPSTPVLKVQKECINVGRPCDVELEFDFTVTSPEAVESMDVVVECPEKFTFTVNDIPYTFADKGYYIDKSFRRSDIRPLLKAGVNTIRMAGHFTQPDFVYYLYSHPEVHESEWNKLTLDTELESIYLAGRFGVWTDVEPTPGDLRTVKVGNTFDVGALPTDVPVANVTPDGFWFFAGQMDLEETVTLQKQADTRYVVSLKQLNAPAAQVFVNGKSAGLLVFAPFTADVTDLLKDGDNTVTIRLYSGLRGALGPHHLPRGDHLVTSPGNFTTFDNEQRDNRGFGWTDNYSFPVLGFEV